jgi:hypothetical protein
MRRPCVADYRGTVSHDNFRVIDHWPVGLAMWRLSLLLAIALTSVAVPRAQAQDTMLWRSVGQWQIRIDKSVDYGCFMLGSYTQGTLLRIGFDQQNRNGYILVGNEAWRSLQVGGRYELILRFDSAAPWRGQATARRIGTGSMVFLYLPFENSQFLIDLARKVNLTIFYAGNVVTQLPLRGTHAATQELIRCQQAADAARPSAQPKDPFSGGQQKRPAAPAAVPGPSGPSFSPSGPSPSAGGSSPAPSFGPGGPASAPGDPPTAPSGGPTFGPTTR